MGNLKLSLDLAKIVCLIFGVLAIDAGIVSLSLFNKDSYS